MSFPSVESVLEGEAWSYYEAELPSVSDIYSLKRCEVREADSKYSVLGILEEDELRGGVLMSEEGDVIEVEGYDDFEEFKQDWEVVRGSGQDIPLFTEVFSNDSYPETAEAYRK